MTARARPFKHLWQLRIRAMDKNLSLRPHSKVPRIMPTVTDKYIVPWRNPRKHTSKTHGKHLPHACISQGVGGTPTRACKKKEKDTDQFEQNTRLVTIVHH